MFIGVNVGFHYETIFFKFVSGQHLRGGGFGSPSNRAYTQHIGVKILNVMPASAKSAIMP